MSSPAAVPPESTQKRSNDRKGGGSGGRTLLWTVLLLSAALLLWMSVFTAQHNPYVSDVSRNKISRSRFIEECKAKVDAEVDRVSQSQSAKFETEYDPRALVSGSVSNPDPKVPGWVLISQVAVSRQGLGSQPVPIACQSDDKGVVQAQVGGGGAQPQQ